MINAKPSKLGNVDRKRLREFAISDMIVLNVMLFTQSPVKRWHWLVAFSGRS